MGIYCAAQLCLADHSHSRTGVQSYGSNKDSGNGQNKVMEAFSLTVLLCSVFLAAADCAPDT